MKNSDPCFKILGVASGPGSDRPKSAISIVFEIVVKFLALFLSILPRDIGNEIDVSKVGNLLSLPGV